jgi:hypothetical protein
MIEILINSVDKKDDIILNTFSIKNNINNKTDECQFTIRKTTSHSYVPELNDEVVVTNNSVNIFGGFIVRINTVSNTNTEVLYEVQCSDYSVYLKRKLVIDRYENETVKDIIDDLLTNYADEAITTDNVSINKVLTSIAFNGLTVAECLDKLADLLNAYWYIDNDKDIHFFYKNTEEAPFDLTDTSSNYIYNTLKIEEDITQLKNRVTVRGGSNPSDTNRIELIVSQDDDQDIFPLGYKFASLPVVKVNDVAVTVGTEYLTDDLTVQCQWSFQEKSIRFTSGNIPTSGDIITIEGKILIPVIVRISNNASISDFGVFEYQINDPTIKSNDQAIERAISELNSYSNEIHDGSFRTYNDGLKAGQLININSTLRGKNIDAIIQSVSIRPHDKDNFVYAIDFATTKTLGIIEWLQKRLKDEDITEDEQETLLKYFMIEESFSFTDEVVDITITSPPYVYDDPDANWNFSTWS